MDIKASIMMAMTVVVIVIMVGAVVLPTSEGYTSRASATSTNSTALNGLNTSNNATRNFTLVTPYATAATVVVTHQGINDSNSTIRVGATSICTLSSTANTTTCTIPAGSVATTTVLNYTSNYPATSDMNITSATITYTQKSTSDTQSWNSGLVAFWGLIGIVVVASAIMMII